MHGQTLTGGQGDSYIKKNKKLFACALRTISNPETEISTAETEISTPETKISTPETKISTPDKAHYIFLGIWAG